MLDNKWAGYLVAGLSVVGVTLILKLLGGQLLRFLFSRLCFCRLPAIVESTGARSIPAAAVRQPR
jgi:hypothetical protein